MIIRSYQEKDREQVRHICLQTANDFFRQNEMVQNLLYTAFCDYYIECEPENCFVAANTQDEIVGYILCAENVKVWYQTFQHKYITPITNENAQRFLESTCNACLKFADSYPAHLHMDILPEYQRMGLGSEMMEALISHLRSKEVSGLMLSVAADNTGAQLFYERMCFNVLEKTTNEYVMGIRV